MKKVKNVIAESAEARRLMNWLEGQKDVELKVTPPKFEQIIVDYPVEELIDRNLHMFQRKLQASRLIKIAEKVREFGFIFVPIILDELFKMVDGQHRATVAHLMGMETVPVVVYRFKNPREKAHFFNKICMPEGGAPAIHDRLDARKIAAYPYESMMYKLIMTDPTSNFYQNVNWKGHVSKLKMTLPVFMKIFNWIGLGIRRKWDNSYDGVFQHVTQSMDEAGYQEVKTRLNQFHSWFYQWAATDNKDLFKEKVLIGFMDFYLMMIEQSPTSQELTRMKRESVRRFKGFKTVNLMHLDIDGVPGAIVSKYNHGRQVENRVKVTELGIRIKQIWPEGEALPVHVK